MPIFFLRKNCAPIYGDFPPLTGLVAMRQLLLVFVRYACARTIAKYVAGYAKSTPLKSTDFWSVYVFGEARDSQRCLTGL